MSGGFDAFVGNPPFAGKNGIVASHRGNYLDWLISSNDGANGNSDLVAYFFRRAFDLLRLQGTFGLIATNTIAQGDTRATGLRWICDHGGTLYCATRRLRWPGASVVVVSVVHGCRGFAARCTLDGRLVDKVTAFLFHGGSSGDPVRLKANEDRAFLGTNVLGKGFTFDDDNEDASPLAVMNTLIEADPRNKERIKPYLGGEELNDDPRHATHKFIIDFGEMAESDARSWPLLMDLLEAKVRPGRLRQGDQRAKAKWWQFVRPRAHLYATIATQGRVLVCTQTSKYRTVTFVPNGAVFDTKVVVFASESFALFAMLQSRLHETWAVFFGSTMKDDPVYTPSDCFETFPFPPDRDTNATLETVGKGYVEYRAVLMVKASEGLTKTYNRFHDPEERSPEILKLHELHAHMDRMVLDAYGWTDIHPIYDFREQLDESLRFTWGEDTRDEVLARLLELNRVRAEEEGRSMPGPKAKKAGGKRKTRKDDTSAKLFGEDD